MKRNIQIQLNETSYQTLKELAQMHESTIAFQVRKAVDIFIEFYRMKQEGRKLYINDSKAEGCLTELKILGII